MKILIDTDWFSAIQDLQPSKQKEVLMAILNYPNGDSDTNLWKKTILPNLEKGKISYFNKLQNLKQNNPQKSNKKNTESVSESDIGSMPESATDTTIREEKIRVDKSKFNEDSIIYVTGQYFDEFPAECMPLLRKYWTDDKIESIRKDLTSLPDHQTTVRRLLEKYPENKSKPKKKQIEISDYGEYEPLREQITKWIEYKKARKESYKTEQSLMAFAKRLFTLSGGKPDIADQIIEQSMANNWVGIFELKQNQKKEKVNFSFYTGEGSFLKPDGEW